MTTSSHEDFDAAVLALMISLESGAPLAEHPMNVLLLGLSRFLRSRFRTLSRDDLVDAVNDALVRFIAAVGDGKVDRRRNAAAYLTRTAQNAAHDLLRQRTRETQPYAVIDQLQAEAPVIDELLDLLASRAMVLELMAVARDEGEHELNALISTYLNLADAGGRPTLRELGDALGVSHTEINRRLERLAELARRGLAT
jgi:RNA polymerase sigma factor (sigma-70 family)